MELLPIKRGIPVPTVRSTKAKPTMAEAKIGNGPPPPKKIQGVYPFERLDVGGWFTLNVSRLSEPNRQKKKCSVEMAGRQWAKRHQDEVGFVRVFDVYFTEDNRICCKREE